MIMNKTFNLLACLLMACTYASSQNVGIGTTTPVALLDVAGDALINQITVGRGAGNLATNTAYGVSALSLNSTGSRNVAIGFSSMFKNSTGKFNVANGAYSLFNNTTGFYNSAFGDDALSQNTTGSSNTAIGYGVLYSNTIGAANTAMGDRAIINNTTGEHNTGIGYQALNLNISGNDNTALGIWAGNNNTTGGRNTFIGKSADAAAGNLENATAIGSSAYVGASNALVLGSINGINGATSNTNVGIGTTTPAARLDVAADILINGITIGRGNANEASNTVFGTNCMGLNTTGYENVGIGWNALKENTTGIFNVATGSNALLNNTTGQSNSVYGHNAMVTNTNGVDNTAIGASALENNTVGNENVALGFHAGSMNDGGSNNTLIGTHSNTGAGGLSNATAIGHRAFVTASNSMVLGMINGVNGATASTNVGIGTTAPTARLDVAGTLHASAWKTANMSADGYAEMGGVLMEWGNVDYNSNNPITITFPKVFTTVYSVTATVDSGTNTGSGANVPVKVMNIGNDTFQIAGTAAFSGDNISKVRWMAVGI
jgi:hypothetical protein